MKPLYEIANCYQSTIDKIVECEEINEQLLNEIESIEKDIESKAINIAAVIKNMEVERDAIGSAIMKMDDRHRKLIRKIESLKNYLKGNLEKCDIKKISSEYFEIKIVNNPPSVDVNDVSLIPSDYFRETIKKELDKVLIRNHLKENIVIPGVNLRKDNRIEIR